MSFKIYLSEALNTPYKWKKAHNSADSNQYNFATDNNLEVRLNIDKFHNPDHGKFWDITFDVGEEYDMTNAGDAFRIFSTVVDVLKSEKKMLMSGVEFVEFAAKSSDRGRVKLYDRLAKMMYKFLDYKYYFSKEVSGEKKYIFTNDEKIKNEI